MRGADVLSAVAIGVGLAAGFLFIVSREWLVEPALLPAVLWGVGTVTFPLLVMQPALGLGMAAAMPLLLPQHRC